MKDLAVAKLIIIPILLCWSNLTWAQFSSKLLCHKWCFVALPDQIKEAQRIDGASRKEIRTKEASLCSSSMQFLPNHTLLYRQGNKVVKGKWKILSNKKLHLKIKSGSLRMRVASLSRNQLILVSQVAKLGPVTFVLKRAS